MSKKSLRLQNFFLVVASYFFYGWWDWRFLSLIFFSSSVDYLIGFKLESSTNQKIRKRYLLLSIFINLGALATFKYLNFFIESFADAFNILGKKVDIDRIKIILPVGISFYTFQTLSYSIDLYRRNINAAKDPYSFFAFVSFFPQLVAGPIERASNLLPQFQKKRVFNFDKAVDGSKQILWGLFKKVVIADNCAELANLIFNNYSDHYGITLFLGGIFFTFQIYGDFSGYSDIAIGLSRLFGFDLKQNFAFPYFSRDIAEFWRRWHISLSTWFRDYVYIPLGGSKGSRIQQIRNIFIIFLVSGFWHGANWTFLAWGFVNACYFIPFMLSKSNRNNLNTVAGQTFLPSLKEFSKISLTFFLTVLAWIFFRADNLKIALDYQFRMFDGLRYSYTYTKAIEFINYKTDYYLYVILVLFMLFEWIGRENKYAIETLWNKNNQILKYSFYYLIIFTIWFFCGKDQDFIYFQF